ncbi:hypothetical protein Tco_0689685 [Tanacetum coccineum]
MTHPPSPYQSTPATNAPSTYQSNPATNALSTFQPRGCGKNKCFWEESKTELLIEVLQDMASDPSWKTNGGFRSKLLRHKEAKGLWDVPFPYFNKLELVYGRDRATGVVAEGFKDAIHDLEEEKNGEIRGENLRKTLEIQLEGIDHSFQMFVQGFNANFGTMANVVAHSMTDENMRQKAASEKLKDCLDELVKLKISTK